MSFITSYFDNVIRDCRFDTAGNDTPNSRWTDFSGNNLHIPQTVGTPTVASNFGSIESWEHPGDISVYTEHDCPTNTFTAVVAIYSDSNELAYHLYDAHEDRFANDDHDAGDGDIDVWTLRDTRHFRLNNATPQFNTFGGFNAGTIPNITEAQWNIVTLVYDPNNKIMKCRINDETLYTGSVGTWSQVLNYVSTVRRIGYITTGGTTLTGDFGYGQYGEIRGDVFVDQPANFNTWIVTAKTYYGIA